MTRPFDMALFLSGVLTGSKVTQQRHLRQARIMRAAIQQRWQRDNPWTWRHKHWRWFLTHYLRDHAQSSRYYYLLTALLIAQRLKASQNTVKSLERCLGM
ncbi:hypothetical protein [Pseudomonas sp. SK2]|uniref:hypothetical protein n=1 Tax=Pseudomonas sp. SK2 TaxID=2841063 RepID=UPI00192B262F|nr:hypothetical protein [Pseudomonas sp. SK2]QQZ36976.1 hypothetical protein IF103_03285 [Pseudomonas sp. SK2]